MAAGTSLLAACGGDGARVAAERTVLERERATLREYLADREAGRLLSPPDLLLVVRGELVQSVLEAGLPQARTLEDRYRVTLREARVAFRSGLALVELGGRAALADDPGVFADITVFGVLEVVGLDPVRSTLAARVEVVALEATDVGVGGLSPPAERLVERLAGPRLEELNRLLEDLEIPVRLQEVVELPGVETDEVTIPPAEPLALEIELREVRVLRDRLWTSVAVGISAPGAAEVAPGDGSSDAGGSREAGSGEGKAAP